jgi:hypothetical protein
MCALLQRGAARGAFVPRPMLAPRAMALCLAAPPATLCVPLRTRRAASARSAARNACRYSKEKINDSLLAGGADAFTAGVAAGAGGGVCQVAVMGPCTFLVTGAVTSGAKMSTMDRAKTTWCGAVPRSLHACPKPPSRLLVPAASPRATHGVKGFYPGGTAIAFRQATNWASRQGFTEAVRERCEAACPLLTRLRLLTRRAASTASRSSSTGARAPS